MVVHYVLAPWVGYVVHFGRWSTGLLFEDLVVASGRPPVHSRDGCSSDGLEGICFGLFCCGRHDFVLGLHVFGVRP